MKIIRDENGYITEILKSSENETFTEAEMNVCKVLLETDAAVRKKKIETDPVATSDWKVILEKAADEVAERTISRIFQLLYDHNHNYADERENKDETLMDLGREFSIGFYGSTEKRIDEKIKEFNSKLVSCLDTFEDKLNACINAFKKKTTLKQ